MLRKKLILTQFLLCVALMANAVDLGTYYSAAKGKKGSALKTALAGIIYKSSAAVSYSGLKTAYTYTDVRSDGYLYDMYSNTTSYTPGSAFASSYSKEGDGYNREHTIPQSIFSEASPMVSDLFHVYPIDAKINGVRSNYCHGEVGTIKTASNNNYNYLGTPNSTITADGCSEDYVFEPNDEYKGDFARTYFYFVTCYQTKLSSFSSYGMFDKTTYPSLTTWAKNMLLRWAENDPVSTKETTRNEAVYNYPSTASNNRNPFIDFPGLEQYIWGTYMDVAFDPDNYTNPYDGSSGGGGSSSSDYELTASVLGLSSSGYADVSGKTAASGTTYAANGMTDSSNSYIQIRYNTTTPSGIISTTSVGNVSKVTVYWNSTTATNRVLNIYGSNTAYTSVSALNSSSTYGTLLGTLTYDGSTTSNSLTVSGSYAYVGIRPSSGTAYCTGIDIEYTSGSSSTPSISVSPTTASVAVGSTTTLTATTENAGSASVTWTSSNTSVATVSGGVVTGVAAGTATITAKITVSGTTYQATSTVTVTSSGGGSSSDDYYEKVTSSSSLTSGQYLIVYESGSLAYNGGSSTLNTAGATISVSISSNQIPVSSTTEAAEFTIDTSTGTIKSASGYYIGNTSSSTNQTQFSTSTAYTNTISYNSSGYVDIVSSAGCYLRYNTSGYFRYYKAASYSNQQAIQLYKKVSSGSGTTLTDPTLSFASSSVSVTAGSTVTNTATTNSTATVTYSSSDTSVATVSSSGVITGVAAGTCTITASVAATSTYNAKSVTCSVTVNRATQTVSFTNSSASTTVGHTVTNTASTTGNGSITYSSSNTSVATVSSTGVVTGVAAGTATITATAAQTTTYSQATATYTVTVTRNTQTVSFAQSSLSIEKGSTGTNVATTTGDGSITYSSSNTSVATVSSTGVVTGVAAGTATITATAAQTTTYSQATATYTVTVTPKTLLTATVSFSNPTTSVYVGNNVTNVATTTSDGSITYSSSNESVATVDATGVVTGVGAGTAVITASVPATENYNSASATYTITVNRQSQTVSFAQSALTLEEGETGSNVATTTGDGSITYQSGNTSVATVDANGTVTAVAAGTAIVTATAAQTTLYNSATATYTVTVTALPDDYRYVTEETTTTETFFYESFDGNTSGTGGNDGSWKGAIATSTSVDTDNDGWTLTNGYAGKECAKFGTTSKKGSAVTPAIGTEVPSTLTLTFKAGAWNATNESTTLKVSASKGTLSASSVTLTKGSFNTYTLTLTGADATTKITFEANSTTNNRFFLDEVELTGETTTTTTRKVLIGDVNRSGEVTLKDVPAAVALLLQTSGSEAYDSAAADVDGQDGVTVTDVQLLAEKILQK